MYNMNEKIPQIVKIPEKDLDGSIKIRENKVNVRFTYIPTSLDVKFDVPKKMVFDDVIKIAYEKLNERMNDKDHYLCKEGKSLDDVLNESVENIISKYCQSADFTIKGGSGGAIS